MQNQKKNDPKKGHYRISPLKNGLKKLPCFLKILVSWGDFFDNGLLLYPVQDHTMQCCTRKPFWVAKPEPQSCSASAFPYFEANAELGVVFNFLVMETGIDESLNLVRKIESRRRNFSQSRKIILYLGPVKMVFLDELSISLPLLETRDKNFTFLFLLSILLFGLSSMLVVNYLLPQMDCLRLCIIRPTA